MHLQSGKIEITKRTLQATKLARFFIPPYSSHIYVLNPFYTVEMNAFCEIVINELIT